MKKIWNIALVAIAAFSVALTSCEMNEEPVKSCDHSWENGACTICGETQTYTLSIKNAARGVQIVMVNGNEVAEGEVIRVKHGEDLTFQLKNVISKLRTEIHFFRSYVDGAEVKTTRVKESENTYTIEGSYITGDVVVDATARCNVALRLNGGSWIAESPAATVVDDVATLTDGYTVGTEFNFTFCLEKDGYYYAGVTDGTTTKYRGYHYKIAGDTELSVLWDAYIDATAMSAEEAGTAMRNLLASGETRITVNLPAEPTDEMYKALRRAIIETPDVEDCTIDLTLRGAKVIGAEAFGYHADGTPEAPGALRSVFLPDATLIKEDAFCDLNILSVSAPKVTEIENGAFYGNTDLAEINFPKLKVVGPNVFGYGAFEEVTLPELTIVDNWSFALCKNLKVLNLPKVEVVERGAFYNSYGLEKITFGTPITKFVDPYYDSYMDDKEREKVVETYLNIDLVLSAEQTEMVVVQEATEHTTTKWGSGTNAFPFGTTNTFAGCEFKSITAAE